MSTSPFFSGRIPKELYDKAEEHCNEKGKKRTDLLIEALSTYLNFPVRTQMANFVPQPPEVTKEMFESLQQQINRHELLITQILSDIFTQHDNRSNSLTTLLDNAFAIHNNSSDNTQIQSEKPDNSVIVNNKLESKITDNDIAASDNSCDNVKDLLEEDNTVAAVADDSSDKSKLETVDNVPLVSDNNSDNADNQSATTQEYPVFQSITSTIVAKKTGLKQTQLDGFRQKIAKKYKKEQKTLTPKALLEQPEEVKTDIVITVDNINYQLLYLGQNHKGQNLWSLIPNDNSRYQSIPIEFNYTNTTPDK